LDNKGFAIPDKEKCQGYKIAQKLLASMQGRWEQHLQGICQFRIEEFTGKGWTDVLDYYEHWMREEIENNDHSPATIKGYWSYYRNWVKPFYKQHPVNLHEIRASTLKSMLKFIKDGLRAKNPNPISNIGKTAQNIMMAFHSMMVSACIDEKISVMPPFPKKKDYGIKETSFQHLWEEEQLAYIDAMDCEEDREIFLWLKYHYRRPCEAMSLYKTDYDQINNAYNIQRSISDRKLTNRTKTGAIHNIPCADEFKEIAKKLINQNPDSPFMFVNPRARKNGKRYTHESLNIALANVCKKLKKPKITVYEFTKHSSCTQFINEKDGSDSELQMLTDHARIESVKKYRKVHLEKKRNLMRKGKVIEIEDRKKITEKV